ncbi:MAG TPA: MBL fold metallo-hydrolase [Firmicutes bacterium]|nr:MBL fold metallo-hydrolase [Bacillota bacterium]
MGRKFLGVCLVIVLLVGAATGTGFALEEMQVFYLDVGQAESTLLRGSDFTILIDAGSWGNRDVLEFLHSVGVETINLFIITHPHADHIGQAAEVLRTLEVLEVWMSGYEHTTQLFEDVLDAVLEGDADYYEPRAGEVFDFGQLRVEVLHPEEIGANLHDSSIVVRASYGEITFLFTGDAERRSENKMLQRGLPLSAQILQLGHHGSRTSSSLDFLVAVDPEVAVYSAGLGNIFDHPHEEVVNRLRILGIPLYGTDRNGTMVVSTDGSSYSLSVAATGEPPIPPRSIELQDRESPGRVGLLGLAYVKGVRED